MCAGGHGGGICVCEVCWGGGGGRAQGCGVVRVVGAVAGTDRVVSLEWLNRRYTTATTATQYHPPVVQCQQVVFYPVLGGRGVGHSQAVCLPRIRGQRRRLGRGRCNTTCQRRSVLISSKPHNTLFMGTHTQHWITSNSRSPGTPPPPPAGCSCRGWHQRCGCWQGGTGCGTGCGTGGMGGVQCGCKSTGGRPSSPGSSKLRLCQLTALCPC